MGFEEPTPIQAQAIPLLLAGKDTIAQALTGTGKTAAFGVPIVERIDQSVRRPQAIVLAPTRELAVQVADQLAKIGRHRGVSVLTIYGGQPIGWQLRALERGVQVIVATPGRLLDHLRRASIDLSAVGTLVLDEADQMLEMGFIEDVESILEQLPAERVTALFSATMPKPIVDLAQRYLREPEMIRLASSANLTAPDIDQIHYVAPYPRKLETLCRVLDVKQPERTVVFCATKRTVDEVVEGLAARGYRSEALHGDISQAMRERVLRSFRAGQTEVLVATDVAARGLDVPEVSHVINFDIPPDPEYYVHRIGRTGRYGRRGVAITFVNPREMRTLKTIERVTGAQIRREEAPTAADAEARELEILRARLTTALGNGGWRRYRAAIEALAGDHDPVDLAAAALHLAATGEGGRRAPSVRPAAMPSMPSGPMAAPASPALVSSREPMRPAPLRTLTPAPAVAAAAAPTPMTAAVEDRVTARASAVAPAAVAHRERPPFQRRRDQEPERDEWRPRRDGHAYRPHRASDDHRPHRDGDTRQLHRDGDDRRPQRAGDDRRPTSAGPWKPKRPAPFAKAGAKPWDKPREKPWAKPAGKPGFRPGGPGGNAGGARSAAGGSARAAGPARPKRPR